MNGYTSSFPIHHSFRCIVIEQQSTCQSLLPPFINRFAKCLLNYSSALSIQQKNLSRAIRGKSKITLDDNSTKDILEILIPGYSEDTVDSLAFSIPTENLKDKHDFDVALQYSILQLSYLCSPRRLYQLIHGMFEGFSNDRAQDMIQSWNIKRSHILIDDINDLNTMKKEMNQTNSENLQHLFILTEQRCLSPEVLSTTIMEVYSNSNEGLENIIDINRITSDNEIFEILQQLNKKYQYQCGNVEIFILFVLLFLIQHFLILLIN